MAVAALALAPALTALVGALLIAAAIDLGILTSDLFRRLPWPLYLVAAATYDAVVGSIRAVVVWSTSGAVNAAQTLRAVLVNPWLSLTHTTQAIGDIAASLQAFRLVIVPYIAASYAQSVFGALQQEVSDRVAAVSNVFWTAYSWVSGVYQYAAAGLAQADTTARYLAQQAIAHSDQVAAQVAAQAQQQAAAVQAEARYLAQQDAAYAQQVGQEAIGYAYQVGLAAEERADQLEREAIGYADQVGRVTSGYAAALVAAAAAAAAVATGAVATRVQTIEDSPCQRFCAPLGGLGQVLQELQDIGLAAAILALAAESAKDAAGAGRGLAAGLGPVARDLEETARGLVGA